MAAIAQMKKLRILASLRWQATRGRATNPAEQRQLSMFMPLKTNQVFMLVLFFLAGLLSSCRQGSGDGSLIRDIGSKNRPLILFELSKEDSKYIPYHTYGVVDKAIEHDPVNGDYEYSIFGKTNKLLEEQIKVVEQEAIDNYERNH